MPISVVIKCFTSINIYNDFMKVILYIIPIGVGVGGLRGIKYLSQDLLHSSKVVDLGIQTQSPLKSRFLRSTFI